LRSSHLALTNDLRFDLRSTWGQRRIHFHPVLSTTTTRRLLSAREETHHPLSPTFFPALVALYTAVREVHDTVLVFFPMSSFGKITVVRPGSELLPPTQLGYNSPNPQGGRRV
jgi:hypothetical protein